jgi:hypothetical protein
MPTNRRRRTLEHRQHVRELDKDLKRHLVHGSYFFEGFQDLDVMRQWWQEVRDVVLPAWVEQFPCTRPFAWWLFEAVPKHGERQVVRAGDATGTGWERYRDERFGMLHTHMIPPLQEGEGAYLLRHGYLTRAEKHLAEEDPGWLDYYPYGRFGWPEE